MAYALAPISKTQRFFGRGSRSSWPFDSLNTRVGKITGEAGMTPTAWDIVMAVLDAAQNVVSQSAGVEAQI